VTLAGDTNGTGTNAIDSSAAVSGQNLTLTGSAGADTITGGGGADTINGGEGADAIRAGTGLDTINITETISAVDSVRIQTIAAANTDTITGFVSGTDILQFASALVSNGSNLVTLQTTNVAAWTSGIPLGSLDANTVFVEFTDTLTLGGVDTDTEVDALLNPAGILGPQANAVGVVPVSVVLFLQDGTDGYVWHWADADSLAGLYIGDVDAAELTLVAKLVGVTNIANGDFALI
jgi:hypothetical protein